ncbi:MAG: TylF/MycF/NovP-related O-methyltransferase [Phycisphaerales bacterium]
MPSDDNSMLSDTILHKLFLRLQNRTMLNEAEFLDNLNLVQCTLCDPRQAAGAIVECGTWRGGMAAALIAVGGANRIYHFFDSFRGLPAPSTLDGEEAIQWTLETDSPRYFDNCTASRKEFEETLSMLPFEALRVHIHEGWFRNTFPHAQTGPISVLRLDADWYQSTRECLNWLWSRLIPGGLVIIDDYDCWVGCRRALHQFLGETQSSEPIRRSRNAQVAYIVKD